MVKLTPAERDILDGLTDFGLHPISLAEARDRLRPFREEQGFNPDTLPVLLTAPESSYKLDKSITPTWSLSLAQHRLAGFNVCPSSTPQCRRVCVADSGKGNLSSVKRGRIWRTRALRYDPAAFFTVLLYEIRKAHRKVGAMALRPNAFSDVRWEIVAPFLFDILPDEVQVYDYTKIPGRVVPARYHLTLSVTERVSESDVRGLPVGTPVAVIFGARRGSPLPAFYAGRPVHDADSDDERFNDPAGSIAGLRAKGHLLPADVKAGRVGDRFFVKA
jgi:hypothetical protein